MTYFTELVATTYNDRLSGDVARRRAAQERYHRSHFVRGARSTNRRRCAGLGFA
jgi:hypothetical protein